MAVHLLLHRLDCDLYRADDPALYAISWLVRLAAAPAGGSGALYPLGHRVDQSVQWRTFQDSGHRRFCREAGQRVTAQAPRHTPGRPPHGGCALFRHTTCGSRLPLRSALSKTGVHYHNSLTSIPKELPCPIPANTSPLLLRLLSLPSRACQTTLPAHWPMSRSSRRSSSWSPSRTTGTPRSEEH